MELNTPLLVYAVLQFIAFFLVLVGTPLDMFRFNSLTRSVTRCLTLWGYKERCSSSSIDSPLNVVWEECPARLRRFHVAQAFAIVSILVYGAAFVLGVIMLFCCSFLRSVCLTLNIVGVATLCVVWVAMTMTFSKDEGGICVDFQSVSHYGAGFALLVTAWVLDILNIFILLLPFHIAVFRELDSANNKSDETSKGKSEVSNTQKKEEE
nr:unnamed protein product [Leishmania braziliensis]